MTQNIRQRKANSPLCKYNWDCFKMTNPLKLLHLCSYFFRLREVSTRQQILCAGNIQYREEGEGRNRHPPTLYTVHSTLPHKPHTGPTFITKVTSLNTVSPISNTKRRNISFLVVSFAGSSPTEASYIKFSPIQALVTGNK